MPTKKVFRQPLSDEFLSPRSSRNCRGKSTRFVDLKIQLFLHTLNFRKSLQIAPAPGVWITGHDAFFLIKILDAFHSKVSMHIFLTLKFVLKMELRELPPSNGSSDLVVKFERFIWTNQKISKCGDNEKRLQKSWTIANFGHLQISGRLIESIGVREHNLNIRARSGGIEPVRFCTRVSNASVDRRSFVVSMRLRDMAKSLKPALERAHAFARACDRRRPLIVA